jgi:para-nitrobenzyl esterase
MEPITTTRHGRIEGREERGICVFRGIPYARPPVGEWRLRAPQPVQTWSGTRSATDFGPAAPQNAPVVRFLRKFIGVGEAQSEDCLYLNVWSPGTDRKRRPVMVWIHGGGFVIGSASASLYFGGRMAKRGDVVVVTINYRLGALGFLNPRAFDDRFEANLGLRDQIAALEWVRDNIEEFGGDPENVTIFGESAGGMSVATLLGVPAAKGLFHRAIAQSGAASNVSSQTLAAAVAERFLTEVGYKGGGLGRLRGLSLAEILAAQARVSMQLGLPLGVLSWQPSIDGDFLAKHPLRTIQDESARRVPLLVGTNRDEWNLFLLADRKARGLDKEALRRRLIKTLDAQDGDGRSLGELAFEFYQQASNGHGWTPKECWSALQSDRFFHYPAHKLAEAQSRAGGTSYAYLFTWSPPIIGRWLGSFHGVEIPFVFGTLREGSFRHLFAARRSARDLSDALQDVWAGFARTGDPSQGALPVWPQYDAQRRACLVFDTRCSVQEDPFGERRQFWADISDLRKAKCPAHGKESQRNAPSAVAA